MGADFDADGDIDYLAGNLGLDTLFKASPNQPLGVYAADFDGNQAYDVIPAVFFPNQKGKPEEFPYHNRLDVDKQLILSKRSNLMHAEFAQINMTEYLSNFPTIKPLHLTATHLQSSFIRNMGNGKFEVKAKQTQIGQLLKSSIIVRTDEGTKTLSAPSFMVKKLPPPQVYFATIPATESEMTIA